MKTQRIRMEMGRRATLAILLASLVFAIASARCAEPLLPSGDLAESAAAGWYCGPADQCTVASDDSRFHDGKSSIHFRADTNADVWLGLRPAPAAKWDISKSDYVEFWLWVENDAATKGSEIGYHYFWRDNYFENEGFFRIGDSEGNYFEYTPANAVDGNKLLSSALRQISKGWILFRVPLKGSNRWTVTSHGTPDLTDIDYFELHGKSKGKGFDVWLDGLKFSVAGTPPQTHPAPPAGVNPEAIEVKLLVYIVNPILEADGNKRLMSTMSPNLDMDEWVQRAIDGFREASHGLVNFKIVDRIEVDAWPIVFDNFQYTDALWLERAKQKHPLSTTMYMPRLARDLGWDKRVMDGEIDEVWTLSWIMHSGEAGMIGEGAHGANGPVFYPPYTDSTRAYSYIGWSMERTDMFFHNYGHRVDATMKGMYGSWDAHGKSEDTHAFNRFTRVDKDIPGRGEIGECHWAVNSLGDYDVGNKTFVLSNADDWLNNYPNMSGDDRRKINCEEWGQKYGSYDWGFQVWKYAHMPHVPGVNDGETGAYKNPLDKGILNNWWRYIIDVDQFKRRDGRFVADWTPPVVTITSPASGTVHGKIPVKVQATDENPIARVDLYVDGKYYATDSLPPHTFEWDASALSGEHTLVAKAYDLPNGWEGTSEPLTMKVEPMSGFTLPVLEPIGNEFGHLYGKVESPIEFALKATDKDLPLTYSAENLPKGATLDPKTGKFSWTPEHDQNGHYWVRFTVTDKDGDHSSEAVIIVVTAPIVVAGFDLPASNADESLKQAEVAVSLGPMDPDPTTRTVKVAYAVTGGQATGGGVDYTLKDGTLTFQPGEITKNITIQLADDALAEGPETIEISLKNPVNAVIDEARKTHTFTINDDDKPDDTD
jgi:hypothetical protein